MRWEIKREVGREERDVGWIVRREGEGGGGGGEGGGGEKKGDE